MRWLALALVVGGCGRIGFDPLGSAGDGGAGDAAGDAAPFVSPQGIGSTFAPAFNTSTTQVPINRLGTEQAGDVLMLAVYANSATAQITPAAGWTTVYSMVDVNMFRAGFFEYRYAPGDPMTFTFTMSGTNLVAWAVIGYHGYDQAPLADMAALSAGAPGATTVTYTTPQVQTRGEVAMLVIDDSGSIMGTGASAWTPPPGMVAVANAYRVAIFHGDVGTSSSTFAALVNVGGTTAPHGAVWVRAF